MRQTSHHVGDVQEPLLTEMNKDDTNVIFKKGDENQYDLKVIFMHTIYRDFFWSLLLLEIYLMFSIYGDKDTNFLAIINHDYWYVALITFTVAVITLFMKIGGEPVHQVHPLNHILRSIVILSTYVLLAKLIMIHCTAFWIEFILNYISAIMGFAIYIKAKVYNKRTLKKFSYFYCSLFSLSLISLSVILQSQYHAEKWVEFSNKHHYPHYCVGFYSFVMAQIIMMDIATMLTNVSVTFQFGHKSTVIASLQLYFEFLHVIFVFLYLIRACYQTYNNFQPNIQNQDQHLQNSNNLRSSTRSENNTTSSFRSHLEVPSHNQLRSSHQPNNQARTNVATDEENSIYMYQDLVSVHTLSTNAYTNFNHDDKPVNLRLQTDNQLSEFGEISWIYLNEKANQSKIQLSTSLQKFDLTSLSQKELVWINNLDENKLNKEIESFRDESFELLTQKNLVNYHENDFIHNFYFYKYQQLLSNELSPQNLLEMFYSCFLLINRISNRIDYRQVDESQKSNYLILGNIGGGKSTTANKLAQVFKNGYGPSKRLEQEFLSKQSAKSVTNQTDIKPFDGGQKYIVDSVGFSDPRQGNKQTWTTYQNDILDSKKSEINFRVNGLKVIIVPVMLARHRRIEVATIQFIYELLLMMNLVNPSVLQILESDIENNREASIQLPKIFIILNNFDLNPLKTSDDMDEDQEIVKSPQEWYFEIRKLMRELISQQICSNVHDNQFNFDNIYQRNSPRSENKQEITTKILSDYILPDSCFITQAKGKGLTTNDGSELEKMLNNVEEHNAQCMSNLFNHELPIPENACDQSFIQPLLMSKESSYEMLKLFKITLDNVIRMMQQTLDMYVPKTQLKTEQYEILLNQLQEFEFIEKLIYYYMSGENTWILQKLPIITFQFLDKLLSEFQMKISTVLQEYREGQKIQPHLLIEFLKKDREMIKKSNEEANRVRNRKDIVPVIYKEV